MTSEKANPVRLWTLVVLGACLALFVYHLFSDRLTPAASAVVQAFVVGIAPEVAGRVVEVNVADNQKVDTGQVLLRLDANRFAIAVEQAEAELALAGQNIGASTAAVAAAEAKLVDTLAARTNIQEQTARIFELVAKGVYSKARADQARATLTSAEADVERARADLEMAKQQLGPKGQDNPEIRTALAALERARLDLVSTALHAPSDGLITGLQVGVGHYAAAGRPVMTFIDIRSVWLQAYLRENNLEHVGPGDRVEVVLDVLPGRVFPARVVSVGWGVSNDREQGNPGDLPTIRGDDGLVPEPKRFPVHLEFATDGLPKGIRAGSQASVVVYGGEDNAVMNVLAWLRIRLVSVLTYVY